MAIAYQPATTPDPFPARPVVPRAPHGLVPVDIPPRALTAGRLVALLAATAVCVALATAIVAGTALFAILNFAG